MLNNKWLMTITKTTSTDKSVVGSIMSSIVGKGSDCIQTTGATNL